MASVRHATSVQGADDPGKSVQAAQWNEDHTLVNVADQTSVDAVSAAVSVVAANLVTLSAAVSTDIANLATLSTQVTNVSGAISTLSLAVSVVEANRNALSQQVSSLSVLHSTLSVQVTNVSGAISTLSLAVSVVEANRNALSQQVSTLSVQHSTLSAQVTTVSGAISTLSLAVSVVEANRNALSQQVSTLSVQVSTVSGAISTLSLAVSTVAANLSALSVLESALSVQVSTLSAQMTSLVAVKVVMLGDQTISVSALTNVSGQSFSVGANNTYCFKYMVIYRAASTNTGLGLSVTFPGMKTFAATAYITSGATGTANQFSGGITASGTKIQAVSCQTANTDFYAIVEGTFTVSTSGTLQLQADSGVGGTSAQVIIRGGTFGALWRGA